MHEFVGIHQGQSPFLEPFSLNGEIVTPENRSQLMEYLAAVQRNTVWSWCAVNEDEKKVYFSIWEDTRQKRSGDRKASYLIQEPYWGVGSGTGAKSAARKDHDEKLSKAFDQGYEPYGYIVVAKDVNANTRE